jgi:2-keto-4-pentenoate hydratase/2-oxohepta-3-ene-1,7-dioic acid hydratase in catechol pathway
MRLLTYRHDGRECFGAVRGDGVVDLSARLGRCASVRELFAGSHLAEAQALSERHAADVALAEIEYRLPVPDADKIMCVGKNYEPREPERHEQRTGARPNLFLRTRHSFAPHRAAIWRPHVSQQLDYEGEIALVIGRGGRYIAEAGATAHIGGLTLANEGTLRDWLRHAQHNITQGKNFDRSGSIGPWIETSPEVIHATLRLRTTVNGELRQEDQTSSLIWPFSYLIHYISQFTTLLPGDIILTGTPAGAGARFDPPRFLSPGDVLKIEVDGIGVLENPIADEPAYEALQP